MKHIVPSSAIFFALHKAGVIEQDPATVRRVVIDMQVNSLTKVYVEHYADPEKLTAGISTVGIEISNQPDGGTE